ncbi:MAG: polysaccharide biosynthesis C-terminal domain-containing protein [Betaproteobacteria bacterium]|nr:polysaccharide biosynthesis C-terminal domain-containing protein [Betaproteobacteria bacterium]
MSRGIVVVAIFAAVTGVARVGQDAVIAWRFGTDSIVDAYYFAVNLAAWPLAVALSTLTMLVVPADAALRQRDPGAAMQFRGELLGAVFLTAVLALPVAWWVIDVIVGSPHSGLRPAASDHAAAGVPALAAVVPLGLIGALLAAWLVATGRHLVTLLEATPSIVLIIVVLAAPGGMLFWGTMAGVAVQVVAMALALRLARELPRPRLGLSAAWSGFSRGALLLLTGQMLFALIPLMDPFFASRSGEGAVASLSYASRLVLGVQGLAGLALQRAGLPLLSSLTATSPADSRRAALRWAVAAAGVGVLIGLVVAAVAGPLVSALFERGRFTAADREQVAMLLRFGMLQMPPFLAGLALATALASARAAGYLALAGAVGLLVKLMLSVWLVAHLGMAGLLLATALMYTATALVSWFALVRHMQHPKAAA